MTLATEPEPTMRIEVTSLTERRIFDFIKGMYVGDPDNDWYVTFIMNGVTHPSGILVDVSNEEIVITQSLATSAPQERVRREDVGQVAVWRII